MFKYIVMSPYYSKQNAAFFFLTFFYENKSFYEIF